VIFRKRTFVIFRKRKIAVRIAIRTNSLQAEGSYTLLQQYSMDSDSIAPLHDDMIIFTKNVCIFTHTHSKTDNNQLTLYFF
jgi:hypothetical protein